MTYERVTVVLTQDEMQRLRGIAQRELRRPRDQAAYLLRSVLSGEQGADNNKPAIADSLATRRNNGFVSSNP